MAQRRTFLDKLAYVFSPKEDKGTSMFERAVTVFKLRADDAWAARPDHPEEWRMVESISRIARKIGIEPPKKFLIYQSDYPNAAMLGNGTVVVGTDLMRILNSEQMDAVLAHELSHHKHMGEDMLVTLPLSAGGVVAGSMLFNKAVGRNRNMSGVLATLAEVSVALEAGGLAALPYRTYMEYRADKEGAQATSAEAMQGGLEAMEKRSREMHLEQYQHMHGKGAHPEDAGWLEKSWRSLMRARDPHPHHKDRIAALQPLRQNHPPENPAETPGGMVM